jgi:hypothetical protein
VRHGGQSLSTTPAAPRQGTWRTAALLTALGTACTTWRYESAPVPAPLSSEPIREAQLFLRDGTELHLYNVRVEGDSIVGYARRTVRDTDRRVAIATSDVHEIGVRQIDSRTLVVAMAIGATAVLLAALVPCPPLGAGG